MRPPSTRCERLQRGSARRCGPIYLQLMLCDWKCSCFGEPAVLPYSNRELQAWSCAKEVAIQPQQLLSYHILRSSPLHGSAFHTDSLAYRLHSPSRLSGLLQKCPFKEFCGILPSRHGRILPSSCW